MTTADTVPAGPPGLAALASGTHFPDLELPDHSGYVWRLSDLVGGDPTFLHFYRGWWCPKEQAFFRRLVRLQDEAEVAYTRIVSISVDPPEVAAAFRAGLGARWTSLSDAGRRHIEELGLREATDTLNNAYLPASFPCSPASGSTPPTMGTGSGDGPPRRRSGATSATSAASCGPTGSRRARELAVVRAGRRAARRGAAHRARRGP
jgi:peroxiredoxin